MNLTYDEMAVLAVLPVNTSTIPRSTLQESLGWTQEGLRQIIESLCGKQIVKVERGFGGPVRRLPLEEVDCPSSEGDLYPWLGSTIEYQQPERLGLSSTDEGWWRVELTGRQGRRPTGGRWSRPDITVAGVRHPSHLPPMPEVVTFEVKTGEIDITGVYQALAFRKAATHAYALFYVPLTEDAGWEHVVEAVRDEAERVGVGMLVVRDPRDASTWRVEHRAPRTQPAPELLDEFLTVQLPPETSNALARHLGGRLASPLAPL